MDTIEKNILEEADTGKKKSGKKKFVIIAVIVAAFLGLACAIIIPKALSRTFVFEGIKAEKIPPEEIEYKWDDMKFHVTELVLDADENVLKEAKGKLVLLNTEIIEGEISVDRVEELLIEEDRIKLKDINPVGWSFIPNYSDLGGFGNVKGFSAIFDVPEDYKLDLSDINVTETD